MGLNGNQVLLKGSDFKEERNDENQAGQGSNLQPSEMSLASESTRISELIRVFDVAL